MKTLLKKYILSCCWVIIPLQILLSMSCIAQDTTANQVQTISIKSRPMQRIGNTFESIWLIDNQTTQVPPQGTLEFDISHRFGTMDKGYEDFYGLYAPSNIRLGFGYTPFNNLMVGFGFTKERLLWDVNLKYAILKEQGESPFPFSVSYFGNMAFDTRGSENFVQTTDRYSYFNQLMVAKKISRDFSAQVSFSASHMNSVEAYATTEGTIKGKMENTQYGVSVLGRYKVSDAFAIIANYDQPITKHTTNNPRPNISFGFELATPLHAFQVYVGNYKSIVPQYSSMYNQNDFKESQILIGFTITRLLDTQEENLLDMIFKRK